MKEKHDHPLMTDIYGQLMDGVHQLAPNADNMVGFVFVAWDVSGNLAVMAKRISEEPFGSGDILQVVNGALVNQRNFEALN